MGSFALAPQHLVRESPSAKLLHNSEWVFYRVLMQLSRYHVSHCALYIPIKVVQVQYDAQDITIADNHIWRGTQGIEVSPGTKHGVLYPLAPQRVIIHGNLLHVASAYAHVAG
jgi:hypothetical protein